MNATRRIMRNMTGHPCDGCGGVIGAKDVAVIFNDKHYHDPPCAHERLKDLGFEDGEALLRELRSTFSCLLNEPDPTGSLSFGTTTVQPEKL